MGGAPELRSRAGDDGDRAALLRKFALRPGQLIRSLRAFQELDPAFTVVNAQKVVRPPSGATEVGRRRRGARGHYGAAGHTGPAPAARRAR